jgi:hypothetical protein
MASDAIGQKPELLHDLAQQVPFEILGKHIIGVAVKTISDGQTNLWPSSLLLLMMTDGTVAVFDNTDGSIASTSYLC